MTDARADFDALANVISAEDLTQVEMHTGEVVILHLGDVAVLTFDAQLSAADADRIRAVWQEHAPGTKVLIIGKPASLAAVIRAAVDGDAA